MEVFIKCFITISWMFIAIGIIMLLSNNVFSPGLVINKNLYYYDFNGKIINNTLDTYCNGLVPVCYSLMNPDLYNIGYPSYSYIDALLLIKYGYQMLLPFMTVYQALISRQ
jgi:hypothetical protein